MTSFVEFDKVWLAYNEELEQAGQYAVEDISLKVNEGEFIAIVGPSGCGKSTFMKLATGLRRPSKGTVIIDGNPVTGPLKITGMAFQAPSLLPWRTTVPRLGRRRPVASFMKVLLPQPLGPTMAMNSPSFTFSVMSSTAYWPACSSSSL